ncbi:MAG: GNAT family N-acetyltransferase [Burkholderiaceae bacterium]|nr:MAG: GNAT family N-acetyltransferase [Burkholderiaceae bacterium]
MIATHISFREAVAADAEAIAQLVNRAYRPALNSAGWTHESSLVSGKRINPTQVTDAMGKADAAILLGYNHAEITACVHVEKHDLVSHIGMLAVAPELQGLGTGKQMLAYAEEYSRKHFAVEKFVIFVLSARAELIAFYQRRGYRKTGITQAYPVKPPKSVPL